MEKPNSLAWLEVEGEGQTHQQIINQVGRVVLQQSFGVQNISDIATLEPITQENLVLFQKHPLIHGPDSSQTRLDTSYSTAIGMQKADWNVAVVDMLAQEAVALVIRSRRISKYLSGHNTDWRAWFTQWLYHIFLKLQAVNHDDIDTPSELQGALEKRSSQKKVEKGKRAALNKKFKQRSQICAIMIEHSRRTSDEPAIAFWTASLQSLQYLQADGMSDEEPETRGEEKVRVVKYLKFRNLAFNNLWKYVDEVPMSMKSLFEQSGAKRLRRVFSGEVTNRLPLKNMPHTFYRPEYLESMKSGEVPYVPVAAGVDILIPIPTSTSS